MCKYIYGLWAALMLVVLVLFVFMVEVEAQELKSEDDYVRAWCPGNQDETVEHVLSDRTRIDCLAHDFLAIEFDWARKWYESMGQAMHYARMKNRQHNTDKYQAVVALIVLKESDYKYVIRCLQTIAYYNLPIQVYVIGKNGKRIR